MNFQLIIDALNQAGANGIELACIFGSQAQGRSTDQSDLDLAILPSTKLSQK